MGGRRRSKVGGFIEVLSKPQIFDHSVLTFSLFLFSPLLTSPSPLLFSLFLGLFMKQNTSMV